MTTPPNNPKSPVHDDTVPVEPTDPINAYPNTGQTTLEQVGMDLLETLESLATVYESAGYFARVFGVVSIAEYTLDRCLDAIGARIGAIYSEEEGGELRVAKERQEATTLLDADALCALTKEGHVLFRNGPNADGFLQGRAKGHSLLCAPIIAGDRRLGVVGIVGQPGTSFSTKDLKLVSAVTSQAAIALSSAQYYREMEIERSKLRSVIEDNCEGIMVLGPDGKTVLCNSHARRLFGITEETGRGVDFLRIMSTWEFDPSWDPLKHTNRPVEVKVPAAGGETILSVRSSSVSSIDDQLVNIVLTFQDVTEERREERLKRDFLSLISHKFRTPITAILGILMMLEDEDVSSHPPERRELVVAAGSRARELAELVDRLLVFGEVLEGSWATRGEANLVEVLENILRRFARRGPEWNLDLEWDVPAEAEMLAVPPSRLRIILENLIENAVKFSDQPWVRVRSRRQGNGSTTIAIEDRGPGIPDEDRDRVFKDFFQKDHEFTGNISGAGIGLPLVSEIVKRLQGTVRIQPAQPHGTIVSITLPAPPSSAEPGE